MRSGEKKSNSKNTNDSNDLLFRRDFCFLWCFDATTDYIVFVFIPVRGICYTTPT
jgi:hypothetical protein